MTRSRTPRLAWQVAAALAFVVSALLLAAAGRAAGSARPLPTLLGASIEAGSRHRSFDATPPRAEPQARRDRGDAQDHPLHPQLVATQGAQRFVLHELHRVGIGPGYQLPRDRAASHFRRRIPRLSSEEPPWS